MHCSAIIKVTAQLITQVVTRSESRFSVRSDKVNHALLQRVQTNMLNFVSVIFVVASRIRDYRVTDHNVLLDVASALVAGKIATCDRGLNFLSPRKNIFVKFTSVHLEFTLSLKCIMEI